MVTQPTGASCRLVLDTNVLVRALLTDISPAGSLLRVVQNRRILILLSRTVLAEYRSVLADMDVVSRYPAVTPVLVETTLKRLQFVGDYIRHPDARFEYPRDPRDEKPIELAIAGRATHIVSLDNDLLSLPTDYGDAGKRFRQRLPGVGVVKPDEFLRRNRPGLEMD